ncbi:hypothetical protein EAS62_25785 [Bradyrhizobium zhanjiangense]|uniref:Uncharacterized protein n=1 Tax=Bradyrhizobium zhanjiangense TaxID=1325107 RepID=A0ABY0DGJ7_9BRAD|nr:hypothetical protein EAS62_25785 [Bradyrhizobium zhanjiangense]
MDARADQACAFPKLDVMIISELLGSFTCRSFVGAMEFDAKLNVAVRPQDIGAIISSKTSVPKLKLEGTYNNISAVHCPFD